MHIILFAPAGDPSSQSSDTLMSRQRIYAPLRVSVFGVRCGPAGVAVDARGFRVRPVSSELWRGKLSRFCLLPGGWVFCLWGRGELSPFWSVAWWLGVLRVGRGLSPFSVLLVGKSGAHRGVGAVRSDIRVPEAKQGRVPL